MFLIYKNFSTCLFYSTRICRETIEEVEPFIDMILDAEGAVFVIPEYNGSFPGGSEVIYRSLEVS